jgi:urease gamma subunit
MADRPKDLYDLLVSQKIMTQADADIARAAAAKTTASTKPAATPKPTSNKYPTIFSSTAATAFINKTFQDQLKRDATAAELKYWKPLLKAAQTAGAASQKYAIKDKTGIQTTITGLDETQWFKDQLATNIEYKKTLKNIDYAAEINTIKTTDPQYYVRQEEKKVYDDAVVAAAGDATKIAALNETTTYGRGLNELLATVRASAEASGATNTDEELTAIAKKLYDKGIGANSAQALTEIENAFKSDTGLVKDQAAALTKIAANKKIYDKLITEAKGDPAKIALANDTTEYGRGLKAVVAALQTKAKAGGAVNTVEELTTLAKKLYDKGIALNSDEGIAAVDSVLKTGTGLVSEQAPDLTKLAADKKVYDKLIAAAGNDPAKIAAANETTVYGRGLKEVVAALQAKAKDNGAINTPEELTALAKKLYDKGVALGSQEGIAAVDAVLKTKNGLVVDQPADLIKLAADKKIYDKLITAAAGDPTAIAKAKTTTAYGRGLSEIEAALKSQAKISGASNTAEELTALAQSLYDTGVKAGSNEGIAKINEAFKYNADAKTGRYSGTAGTTIADLQKTASDNGLDLQKNFGDQISGWLTAIASGEDVKNIKQQIREVAKLGQPDSIKKLIDSGTDLKTIYAPYRNTMASVLEIQDPNSIRLDDPSLRMAITPAGELNLYDYQKTLRKDDRWQYTQQANSEVARATKQVLQDFGFMG